MNYPSVIQNPMLKKRPMPPEYDNIQFSNHDRPISAPSNPVKRPLSSNPVFKSRMEAQSALSKTENQNLTATAGGSTIKSLQAIPALQASSSQKVLPPVEIKPPTLPKPENKKTQKDYIPVKPSDPNLGKSKYLKKYEIQS